MLKGVWGVAPSGLWTAAPLLPLPREGHGVGLIAAEIPSFSQAMEKKLPCILYNKEKENTYAIRKKYSYRRKRPLPFMPRRSLYKSLSVRRTARQIYPLTAF